ncbi:hypothetical protein F4805DRAFT_452041 [Annulohypoxylon moriforme]|nr:hypothetical protein F4805DRAFT_452041 [Annulohypoxylon moriforme]
MFIFSLAENCIQTLPSHDSARLGALGMGQSWATALNFFMIVSYTIPLFAGILADGLTKFCLSTEH